ncbi:hypothetical protein EDWATA_00530 [Edwardsiella tarda ATCC 23685]|uniref:Uncharacterized protein n=1 Tax=Edwardsiella tarda ATCC 23685 TaxID=500638 RepID=D4F1E5_EDWTA|nr:hypothetical protein EDWATA_00530 [Edwardsiella tarda ATCC 23685]
MMSVRSIIAKQGESMPLESRLTVRGQDVNSGRCCSGGIR